MSDMVQGLYPKQKHENAPDFVIGKLSVNVEQFRAWMKDHLAANPGLEWINIDMKVSKAGKGYGVIDDWKPDGQRQTPAGNFEDEEIPF